MGVLDSLINTLTVKKIDTDQPVVCVTLASSLPSSMQPTLQFPRQFIDSSIARQGFERCLVALKSLSRST